MGNNDKHVEIDKIIESDYKYFGFNLQNKDKELYKIRAQAKNIEVTLNQKQKLITR